MASKEKVRKFLEASETHQHYSTVVDYILTYFIRKAEKEGNDAFAAELKKAKDEYGEEFQGAIDVTDEVYCEIFTDEELDDLIVLHSNPALKKLRGLASEIMNKILEKYSLLAG